MSAWRNPLGPVGLVLVVLGLGNWYTGLDKSREYEHLLAAGTVSTATVRFEDFDELSARTNASLLSALQKGNDEYTFVNGKLDFYKVVQSGGRLLVLIGLFAAAAAFIHTRYRQREAERAGHLLRQS